MEFLKKFFKDEERVVGLSGFKKDEKLSVFVPKCPQPKPVYTLKYEKNFFLL